MDKKETPIQFLRKFIEELPKYISLLKETGNEQDMVEFGDLAGDIIPMVHSVHMIIYSETNFEKIAGRKKPKDYKSFLKNK